ncbi:MAG: acetate--CoA ligase family protein [Deltaproteobacteria bacterium]|nr:acetate--CoA ligase family protein [Deltaproteobacteria bacterium]
MKNFFYPNSIAVAGASSTKDKLANFVISNLVEVGYPGEVFAIGSDRGKIFGKPIFISIKDMPKPVDLLVIVVPSRFVPGLLTDAGEAGIKRVVIITAGFNESGDHGDRLAGQLKGIASRYSIRFIGPNCQGVTCASSRTCVPFSPFSKEHVKNGGVSIITQSGSIGWIGTSGLSHEIDGISKVASIGNKLDVDELELLEYFIADKETKMIVLYLESFSDGRKLFEIAGHSKKPIIVLKSNISGEESELALSHTVALASDDRMVGTALAQAGILRAFTFKEVIDMCKALSLPVTKGNNFAVLASSGGMAIIGGDTIIRENLVLKQFPDGLIQRIRKFGNWDLHKITNPLDIGGIFKSSSILDIVDTILSFDEIDGAVLSVFKTGPPMYELETSEVIDRVENISKKHLKPIAMNIVSDPCFITEIKKDIAFPIFDTMEDSVRALSNQWKYQKMVGRARSPYQNMDAQRIKANKTFSTAKENQAYYNDLPAMELAKAYGIACEIPVIAADPDEAKLKAAKIGYPLVMKICSPDISHKTDVGGVKVNIKNETELEKAFIEIMDEVKRIAGSARIHGVLLQKMISGGMELIFGGKYDHDFGPVIMFGMGGIFVEAFEDVSFRLAPICREEAHEMIEEVRGYSLLQGIRGKKPFDISSLADALERFSILLSDFPEITEMDLNPVKIFNDGRGLIVLDGRLS